jgi:hypothetical protein
MAFQLSFLKSKCHVKKYQNCSYLPKNITYGFEHFFLIQYILWPISFTYREVNNLVKCFSYETPAIL